MIGILGAMAVEVERLIGMIEGDETRLISGRTFHRGRLCGQEVVVAQCGVGKVNAALCCEAMILAYHPSLVVNVGVAGALTDVLAIGDVAVARDLVQYDVDTTALGDPPGFVSTVDRVAFPCAEWAVAGILRAVEGAGLRGRAVRIASGDRFNDDQASHDLIAGHFQADACEMEGCPIAQVCWVNGVDCAVIRAISDSTAGSHNLEYGRCRDLAARNATLALTAFLERLD